MDALIFKEIFLLEAQKSAQLALKSTISCELGTKKKGER
jgi:hypothetical protein